MLGTPIHTYMSRPPVKLSIVIPAFNEEATIADVLERVKAVQLADIQKEIVVVDDASTDRTASIAKNITGIRMIHHQQNTGKGGAVKSGIAAATGDIVALDTGFGARRIVGSSDLVFIGIVVLGIAAIAAFRRETPVVLLATALGAIGAGFAGVLAVAAPTDDIFAGFGTPDYRSGGWFAIAAVVVGVSGALLTATGYEPRARPARGRHPAGVGSVAVGVLSFFVPFLGVLAIGLGRLGVVAAAGDGKDRNARLGIVLGWVTTILWAVGFVVGIALALTGNV